MRRTVKLDRIRDLIDAGITRRYLENDRRWLQRREDVERELIGSLIADAPNPAAAGRAARILGVDLETRRWTVAIATRPKASSNEALRDALGDGDVLLREAHGHVVAIVEGEIGTRPDPAGITIGIGGCYVGADGVHTSHREALLALEIARRSGRPRVRHDRASLERLLLGLTDPGDLVTNILAPLDALSDRKRRPWQETLEAYLDSATSITLTAERLGQHPQSVRYRIDRLRTLLGGQLDDPESRLALHVALKASRLGIGQASGS